jgi:hypothetical protein
MRRLIVLSIVLLAATTGLVAAAVVARTDESTGVSRVERVISTGWRSDCGSDSCGIQQTWIQYTTPASAEFVDVTVTITLDYRTTRGDAASAGVSINDGTPPSEPMRPREVPLRPSAKRTTTTLTFLKRDLAADGMAYTFRFGAAPRDLNGNGRAVISGERLTAVIESWTAGD